MQRLEIVAACRPVNNLGRNVGSVRVTRVAVLPLIQDRPKLCLQLDDLLVDLVALGLSDSALLTPVKFLFIRLPQLDLQLLSLVSQLVVVISQLFHLLMQIIKLGVELI